MTVSSRYFSGPEINRFIRVLALKILAVTAKAISPYLLAVFSCSFVLS